MRTDLDLIKVECNGLQFPIKGGNGTFVIPSIVLYVGYIDTFKSACKSITKQIKRIMGKNKEIYGVLSLDDYNTLLNRTFGKRLDTNVYQYDLDNRTKEKLLNDFTKNLCKECFVVYSADYLTKDDE